ncbi:glycosyltransferase family 2 protein [Leptolyngbya sp. NK1-12]|uniref:Glycosyltransferase family 2 protein n=1 Tax=Leptolyngbya sp. NK1-12 TaxID=2547451 RepID=A0AA97AKP8_9CYAN|nr:glycosyltransferase family A protein [Leptolyngbya sp. NK1-12]WNZ23807.1 glycosyltransferase family 2 protein [Leptolyngbya sp. NK1-12]
MPKVSVIIPAYNAMAYLPETMTSALSQTFADFEMIVINDGSSDGIEQWVAQLSDARVKLISQANQGLAGARNTGIAHAQGEYLAFLDADDLWDATKLEKQVRVLEECPEVGLVYTWVALIDQNGHPTGRTFEKHVEGYVWRELVGFNIVGCGSVPLIRRSCLERVGWFDIQLSRFNINEDWDMWLRIAAFYPFRVIKEPLVLYRQHFNNASKNWPMVQKSYEIVIEKAFANATPDLLPLKQQSYASANLCLAWKAIQSREQNYRQAIAFRDAAVQSWPKVRFSKEYVRLTVAMILLRWLGSTGYQQFLALFHQLRRSVSVISHKIVIKIAE